MWKDIFTFMQTVLTVSKDLERTREDVKELKRNVLDLTLALQKLSNQLAMSQQSENNQREKLALQLQLEMLKLEKRVAPAPPNAQP